jgi:putative membrane protein
MNMLMKVAAQLFRGFCMGTADVVPGVSGGTVALVLGIYERLIANVRQGALVLGSALKLDRAAARRHFLAIDWWFLVPLLGGIGLAVLTLARTLEHLLEEEPVRMAALFFGLVVASIYVAWGNLKNRDWQRLAVLATVAVLTFFLLGLRSEKNDDPAIWFVLIAGSIAICAMILPGISGSFILLMLGLYDYIIGAVNNRDVVVIGIFAIGAVVGLALFSSVLAWMLRRHHDTVLAALIGLMAGSLRVLWPWPDGTDTANLSWPVGDDLVATIALGLLSCALVVGLAELSRRANGGGAHEPAVAAAVSSSKE